MSLSRVLPTLHSATCYVHRVHKVVRNIMHQMTSLYHTEKKKSGTVDVSDVHFQVCLAHEDIRRLQGVAAIHPTYGSF